MSKFLIWATLLACAWGAWADQKNQYAESDSQFTRYLYQYEGNAIKSRGVFSVSVPTFEELRAAQNQFRNYEEFVDYLLRKAPSLKRHFIVLHHSPSLQMASPAHPRYLLFDGGSVFAFSEHPGNRVPRVEILETDRKTYEISLREIAFEKGGVRFREKPKACAVCHGSPAKPLWDPYDFWPNAFGAAVGVAHTRQEHDGREALMASAAGSPLASRLVWPAKVELGREEITPFTQYIQQINFGRWMNQNLAGKDLSAIRHPLLATLNGCFSQYPRAPFPEMKKQLLEYFEPGAAASTAPLLDEMYSNIAQARSHFKNFQDRLVPVFFPGAVIITPVDHERLTHETDDLTLIRWLLELAGIEAGNLSSSLIANDYLIGTPSNFVIDLLGVLYETRPDLFTGLKVESRDLGTGMMRWLNMDCGELKTESLRQARAPLRAAGIWRGYLRIPAERPVVSRCAKCHSEGLLNPLAPPIPFHDSDALARLIRDPNSALGDKILQRIQTAGAKQMPPDNPLNAHEIDAMKEFVEALR